MSRCNETLALLCVVAGGCVSTPSLQDTPPAGRSDDVAPAETVTAGFPEDHRFPIAPLSSWLFEDENELAERHLAAWVESRGWRVADLDRTRTVFTRARAGRNALDGSDCGLSLSGFAAAERYADLLGNDGEVRARIVCEEAAGCTLSVVLQLTGRRLEPDIGVSVVRFEAPFDASLPWPDALEQAIEGLEAVAEEPEGLGVLWGRLVGTAEAHAGRLMVSIRPVRLGHGWSEWLPDDALVFEGEASPLARCFETEGDTELLIAIDGAGGVSRCQPRGADHAEALCACAALEAHGRVRMVAKAARRGGHQLPAGDGGHVLGRRSEREHTQDPRETRAG